MIDNNYKALLQNVKYVRPCAIIRDVYPFFPPGATNGPTTPKGFRSLLTRVCRRFYEASKDIGAVYWIIGQGMKIDRYKDGKFVGSSWRWPTPAEVRWQVWTSIQEGAKGFFFFLYRYKNTKEHPENGDEIEGLCDWRGKETPQFKMSAQIGKRLQFLAPLLLELEPSDEKKQVMYWENTSVSGRTFIHRKNGKRFLIVVNHNCLQAKPIRIELGYWSGLLGKDERLYNMETGEEFGYHSFKTAYLSAGDGAVYFIGTKREWVKFEKTFYPSHNQEKQ